jgi:hypothetical protein
LIKPNSFVFAGFVFGKSGLKWGDPSGRINKKFFGFCTGTSAGFFFWAVKNAINRHVRQMD